MPQITAQQIDEATDLQVTAMAALAGGTIPGYSDWWVVLDTELANIWRDILEWLLFGDPVGPYPHPVYCGALEQMTATEKSEQESYPAYYRRALKVVAGV